MNAESKSCNGLNGDSQSNGGNHQVNGLNQGSNGVKQNGHNLSEYSTNGAKSESNIDTANQVSYDEVSVAAAYLLKSTKYRPTIGIVCGSGLGSLGENIENADVIPYQNIPNFPVSTVEGHAGQMVFGTIENVPVMCMQGRHHYYEGYSTTKCCVPIRVMKLVGITHLILTNAAGGLNDAYRTGDFVIAKDHINLLSLSGHNPLRGPNESRFGQRFIPMNKAYDAELRGDALKVARQLGLANEVHEGVYMSVGGPSFETVGECRLAMVCGADYIGMSTAHEAIVARHCDIKVLAVSFISNECVKSYECDNEPNHEEVVEIGKQRQPLLCELIRRVVVQIASK